MYIDAEYNKGSFPLQSRLLAKCDAFQVHIALRYREIFIINCICHFCALNLAHLVMYFSYSCITNILTIASTESAKSIYNLPLWASIGLIWIKISGHDTYDDDFFSTKFLVVVAIMLRLRAIDAKLKLFHSQIYKPLIKDYL